MSERYVSFLGLLHLCSKASFQAIVWVGAEAEVALGLALVTAVVAIAAEVIAAQDLIEKVTGFMWPTWALTALVKRWNMRLKNLGH